MVEELATIWADISVRAEARRGFSLTETGGGSIWKP
jgi:hypothetical protein